jgi:hypothetical protein
LAAGVYYQKCYDPECRHYRSNYMPLPTEVWQAYKHLVLQPDQPQQQQQQQQSGPQEQHQQSGPQMQQQHLLQQPDSHKHQPQPPGPQIQHQPQQPVPQHHAVCDDEDEECLRVLLLCEQQQQQKHSSTPEQASHVQLPLTQKQLQPLPSSPWQQQQLGLAGRASSAQGCCCRATMLSEGNSQMDTAVAGVDSGTGADEDEWCVQLLQDVEQLAALRCKVIAG